MRSPMSSQRTMAEIYSIAKARRRKPSPRLALPDSLLVAADTFGLDLPPTFTAFHLRRTKRGTEVYIRGGRLTLNLSICLKCWPASFTDARMWIAAVALRHGWQMTETKSRI